MEHPDAAIDEYLRANHLIRRHQLACKGLERLRQYQAANQIIQTLRRGYTAPEPKRWTALWQ